MRDLNMIAEQRYALSSFKNARLYKSMQMKILN